MLTGSKILTGVGAILCAAHRDKDGRLHGHTWEITAWWEGQPDAAERQEALNNWIFPYDHGVLHPDLSSGEALAALCGTALGCAQVDVSRPLERIYARWLPTPEQSQENDDG